MRNENAATKSIIIAHKACERLTHARVVSAHIPTSEKSASHSARQGTLARKNKVTRVGDPEGYHALRHEKCHQVSKSRN